MQTIKLDHRLWLAQISRHRANLQVAISSQNRPVLVVPAQVRPNLPKDLTTDSYKLRQHPKPARQVSFLAGSLQVTASLQAVASFRTVVCPVSRGQKSSTRRTLSKSPSQTLRKSGVPQIRGVSALLSLLKPSILSSWFQGQQPFQAQQGQGRGKGLMR